eukprot:gene3450-4335_t
MTRDEFDRLCLVCFDREGVSGQWHELHQHCSGRTCDLCVRVLAEDRKPMSLPCPFCRRVLPPPRHPTQPPYVERDLTWKMAQLNLAGAAQASPSDLPCWVQLCALAEPWYNAQELADALGAFVQDHERTFRGLCAGARVEYRQLLWRIASMDPADDTVILLATCWFTDSILVVLKSDCPTHLVIFTSSLPLEQAGDAMHLPWGLNELRWQPLYDWLDTLDYASQERVHFARFTEKDCPYALLR